MTNVIFGLFGVGGFGAEVIPLVRAQLAARADAEGRQATLYFVETELSCREFMGLPVISEAEFLALEAEVKYFNMAIGSSTARQAIAERCEAAGCQPMTLKHATYVELECNEIGVGGIFCAHSMVTSNARIGRYVHANLYTYIAHDCVIGDFVTFAPRVSCNGNIHIHDHAYIGTGAVIRQGTPDKPLVIGEGAIVGMGAVVTKDVAPHSTVIGNPARKLEK